METKKQGQDAGDTKPPGDPNSRDSAGPEGDSASNAQDAPNTAERTDKGKAIPAEDLSSANDD